MPRTRRTIAGMIALATGTLLVALTATPGTAAAPSTVAVPATTVATISRDAAELEPTPELKQYLATLTPGEREEFVRTQLPATQTLTVTAPVRQSGTRVLARGELAPALERAALGGAGVSTAGLLATGCWTQRWSGSAKAAAGNTLYTYFTTGGWCSSGSTITSAWVADAGGETSTPGWRYEGVIASDSGIVSNQGRSYSQEHFVLSVGGWDVQSASPCVRVLGRTSGSSSAQYSCGLS